MTAPASSGRLYVHILHANSVTLTGGEGWQQHIRHTLTPQQGEPSGVRAMNVGPSRESLPVLPAYTQLCGREQLNSIIKRDSGKVGEVQQAQRCELPCVYITET
ncbi:hypothetical protein DPEC_G00226540 [Dallia pectoralis]|uniref:Uncharacterized protein n=1 Tax=Dallia pectoralis TaxID=75939 RepID=A0ACC2G0M6_DALPE|nr:hypothetical protein DPEC_G00226540 [Dallia pectoralis]